jgi:hypothetical protein
MQSTRVLTLLSKVVVGHGNAELDIEIGKILKILPEECAYVGNHNKETNCHRVISASGIPFRDCPRFTQSLDATIPFIPRGIGFKLEQFEVSGLIGCQVGDSYLKADTMACALIAALLMHLQEEKEEKENQLTLKEGSLV